MLRRIGFFSLSVVIQSNVDQKKILYADDLTRRQFIHRQPTNIIKDKHKLNGSWSNDVINVAQNRILSISVSIQSATQLGNKLNNTLISAD